MKMSEKGGLMIDRIAHTLMKFKAAENTVSVLQEGTYTAFYHEDQLFSVRNNETGIVSLVYAKSHREAIDRVKKSGVDWEDYQRLKRYEKQYGTEAGIKDPLEPLKISSALNSEIMKFEYRSEHDPKSISVLDLTIISALQEALERRTAENE